MDSDSSRDWISKVLGVELPEGGVGLSHADLAERLKTITEDAKAAKVLDAVSGQLRAAAQAVMANAPQAVDLLDALEARMADLARSRRDGEVKALGEQVVGKAKTGLVALAKLRLRVQAARTSYETAVQNLQTACETLIATPSFANDPRSSDPEVLKLIDGVGERVPDIEPLVQTMQDTLDDMATATTPETRQSKAAAAVKAIESYRASLNDPILTVMESTDAGEFPIASELNGALDALAEALRA